MSHLQQCKLHTFILLPSSKQHIYVVNISRTASVLCTFVDVFQRKYVNLYFFFLVASDEFCMKLYYFTNCTVNSIVLSFFLRLHH